MFDVQDNIDWLRTKRMVAFGNQRTKLGDVLRSILSENLELLGFRMASRYREKVTFYVTVHGLCP